MFESLCLIVIVAAVVLIPTALIIAAVKATCETISTKLAARRDRREWARLEQELADAWKC